MNDFKDKVVYQIYPKSFMDSNGDGFGDLKGVTAKLDYLADLGVDYLWLTPFFPSPQRDNGYDVADYRAVDPRYGTMEDLEELIREADRRGIGLMLDMVFNILTLDKKQKSGEPMAEVKTQNDLDFERKHEEDLRRIRDFRLMDDNFMSKVFEDKPCAEFLLRIILNRDDM